MMTRKIRRAAKALLPALLFLLLFSLLSGGILFGQEGDQKIDKIPQRVFFEFSSPPPETEPEGDKTLRNLLEIYYTTISAIQPIVRVEESEKAHAIIRVDWKKHDAGTELRVTLSKHEEILEEHKALYTGNMDSFILFLETSSGEFARRLELVMPEIKLETRITDERTEKMVEEVDFSEKLKRPFELTLYTSVFTRDLSGSFGSENMSSLSRFSILPLSIDFAWYPWDNVGFYTSLFFDVANADYHALADPANLPKDVFLLPGFGIAYRTLDRIAGTFFFGYNLGPVFAQSGVYFHSFFSLSPIVTFNITERIAIRARLNFGINFSTITSDDEEGTVTRIQSDALFLQILSLGFTFRP